MNATARRQKFDGYFSAQKDRLKEWSLWFPYPSLIAFGLILLFTGHLFLGLNPRLGNPAQILPYAAPAEKEGSIWVSVSLRDHMVTVSTADRKVFQWPERVESLAPLMPFIKDLKRQIVDLTITASLAKGLKKEQSLVVMAVDQSLQYAHIKPIIYALAYSGISEYAFETRQPLRR